jgi:hypothetical protein
MTDFDPVVAAALDRALPSSRCINGDWGDVVRRAEGSERYARIRRRRTFGVAVVVALTLASAAEAGVLGRAASAFIDVLSPASPPATQILARAGRQFDRELRAMARAFPGKTSPSAPTLDLTAARQVTMITTARGRVAWDAAVDRSGRGYCQVAVRHGLSLGGDCQVTDAHGYAISLATSGDTPGRVIVTVLAPNTVAAITITGGSGETRRARRFGRFFFTTIEAGSPITITQASDDGVVLRRSRFSDRACTDGVSGAKGLPLVAGAGFTYCTEGGVIARFPAARALAPVCPATGCGLPIIENNQQAGVSPPGGVSPSPVVLLNTIRSSLHTSLIRSARFGEPPPVAGPGRPWLYVGLGRARRATGVLGQFYANLLAGAYAIQAARDELPQIGGLDGFAASARACQRSPTAARCRAPFGYGRFHLEPGVEIGTSAPVSSLESDIRLGLASAHLRPVSITFAKPLGRLVPVVVARPTTDQPVDVAGRWDTIFGALPAAYLEIVRDDGRPISATAHVDALGNGFSWRRPA